MTELLLEASSFDLANKVNAEAARKANLDRPLPHACIRVQLFVSVFALVWIFVFVVILAFMFVFVCLCSLCV